MTAISKLHIRTTTITIDEKYYEYFLMIVILSVTRYIDNRFSSDRSNIFCCDNKYFSVCAHQSNAGVFWEAARTSTYGKFNSSSRQSRSERDLSAFCGNWQKQRKKNHNKVLMFTLRTSMIEAVSQFSRSALFYSWSCARGQRHSVVIQ